ncbi:hypothetical protein [Egbenema bharatensis]|uniref:hypothetical protein n=1 Tax=Egbenema bharatensis TaxID=3463334 RepID=UPI003A85A94B
MSIPIVLIHRSDSDYLLYSLMQAKIRNPDSRIYLLGDFSNNHYQFSEHYQIDDYFKGANDFAKSYQHFSTNPFQFELFCFQRWFVLRDFMRNNAISQCFHMDSDVMLFAEITSEYRNFSQFDFTLSRSQSSDSLSPHCSFINSLEALDSFCDFLMRLYREPQLTQLMEQQFLKRCRSGLPGGACDMTAFREYVASSSVRVGYTSDIINDSVYDHRIRSSDGFVMNPLGLKQIQWIDNQPFGKTSEGDLIKFNALHFQGNSKKFMKQFLRLENHHFNYSIFRRQFSISKNYFVSTSKKVLKRLRMSPAQH